MYDKHCSRKQTTMVALDEIHLAKKALKRLECDHGQINKMRIDFEASRVVVPVKLHHRAGGGYNIEDGRHRVIAAILAGNAFIEAVIVE